MKTRSRPYLFDNQFGVMLGLDEVGTGAIAGPVYACGVLCPEAELREEFWRMGLTDSKAMTAPMREALFAWMVKREVKWHVASAHPRSVEREGVWHTVTSLFTQIIDEFILVDGLTPQTILLDGEYRRSLPYNHKALPKADVKSTTVSAASVIAKVLRDREMVELADYYPGYGWEKNMGYSTKGHVSALRRLGVTDVHRGTFGPVIRARERQEEVGVSARPVLPSQLLPEERRALGIRRLHVRRRGAPSV